MKTTLFRSVRHSLAASLLSAGALTVVAGDATTAQQKPLSALEHTLAVTAPLEHAQGERIPLFLWTPNLPVDVDDATLESRLTELKARGIALYHRWGGTAAKTLETYARVGRLQKKLGMPIAVDATGIAHGFYTGDPTLSHVDAEGKPFRDTSFFWNPGCPFTVKDRCADKRALMASFAEAYRAADLPVDYWAADWEFDGPNEWKQGWAAARRCTRCRERVAAIDTDFAAFQKAVRDVRTAMQAEAFVQPMRAAFPDVRIGNYAMNPHDGYRYWWDFYEEDAPGAPHVVEGVAYRRDQRALYRPWATEFEPAGYTVAMPVLYTWYTLFGSYDDEPVAFRWFRAMLLEVSSVCANTPAAVPIIPFVHWQTTNPPKELPAGFEPMSESMYRELLWHALLRGTDSFAMWSPEAETPAEVKPVHEVYAASLAYSEFILQGTPVTQAVPQQPAPVVSALRLGNRLLVRRTDFSDTAAPFVLKLDDREVPIPRRDGECVVMEL